MRMDAYIRTFSPSEISSYFKFTFVRNPWDRLVSAFHFLKAGGFGPNDRAWAARELAPFDDFGTFVHEWVTPENIRKWFHFRPQSDYIFDQRRKVPIDFIGLVENMESDFRHVAARVKPDASIAHTNKSSHRSYLEYYDDSTRQIVEEVYSDDVRALGYSFDNSSLPTQRKTRERRSGRSLT
jgi:hypothetical protein